MCSADTLYFLLAERNKTPGGPSEPQSAVATSRGPPAVGEKACSSRVERVPTWRALTTQRARGRRPGDLGPGEEAPRDLISRRHASHQ